LAGRRCVLRCGLEPGRLWCDPYEVFAKFRHVAELEKYFRHLVVIHSVPREHWQDLVKRMIENNWTVQDTYAAVREFRSGPRATTRAFRI
jgi:hypothetical protein